MTVCLFSCSEKQVTDAEVQKFINSKTNLILVSDSINAKKILDPYYKNTISYLSENGMDKRKYYLIENSITVSEDIKNIHIPLRHFESFREEIRVHKENSNSKAQITITGNLSGKDGYLVINGSSNEVIGFKLYQ